jgi:hypothetical protein
VASTPFVRLDPNGVGGMIDVGHGSLADFQRIFPKSLMPIAVLSDAFAQVPHDYVRTFLARHVGINRTGLGCALSIGCAANAGLGCVLENFLCAVGSLDGKRFGRGVDFGDCPVTAWTICWARRPVVKKLKAAVRTKSRVSNLERMS